ncbi:MAG: PEP/pyruvate-binding domain-containing protein [Deltaproteobacteria bacterium]|nr:PEP/pyruvate-binding domain-containing protein [Deltaproteobacteria bacterium]
MNFSQLFRYWTLQVFAPDKLLRHKYEAFKELLRHDKKSLELITDLEEVQHAGTPVDWARIDRLVRALNWSVGSLVRSLVSMHPGGAYSGLERRFRQLESSLAAAVALPEGDRSPPYTLNLSDAAAEPGLAGGKAHTLSRLLRDAGLPGPRGFVITTNAFRYFLHHNGLRHRLDELLAEVSLDDWERLERLSGEMTEMVLTGEVPPEIREETARRLASLKREGCTGPWSLRSSAASEDGELSFAGQYASVLGVGEEEDFFVAYKRVLASKYAPRAVAYRIRGGLADPETPMAVLVMQMVDARVSGVVYTRDREPSRGEDSLAVYAVPGLGYRLVDGSAEPEVHYFTREAQPQPLGSLPSRTCPVELTGKVCLDSETAQLLAGWGMRLEGVAGCPQDIEWTQDHSGSCYILQARPLFTRTFAAAPGTEEEETRVPEQAVLLEGGVTASAGVGVGRVYLLESEAELGMVPDGAVLVSPTLTPALAGIIRRLRAVVAAGGSRASHFASIAREYGLPVLAAVREAAKLLPPGETVTVDAARCRVYRGEAAGLVGEPQRNYFLPKSAFQARLQKALDLISPLHLLDPASPDFKPENCASMHDVTRFAHEKGMAEMFSLVGRSGRGLARARQLESDLPLVMYILDLEGGIAPEAADKKTIRPEFITSPLMRACWAGLTHPDVNWRSGLIHIDWEELDRVSAGILSLKSALLASYAIVAQEYLHLVLRFGYHFAVLDALGGDNPEANYIAFRFKGGGAHYESRLLRVELIKAILEWAGFTVKTRGDLLDARFDRRPAEQILARLTLLGILQGKTQLLDMALSDQEQVNGMVDAFKESFGQYVAKA